MDAFKIGDRVEVIDDGLAMLRRIMPDAPPNNTGVVTEVFDGGYLLVEFDDTGSAAPYDPRECRPAPAAHPADAPAQREDG